MSLKIPRREELLASYKNAERYGKLWGIFDLGLIITSLYYLQTERLKTDPLEAIIVVGVSLGPTLLSLLYLSIQKKKQIEDLREDIKFGKITKSGLLSIVKEVMQKMNIPAGDIKFFVTAEKQVNAGALAVGLGWLLPKMRAVYLNRGTLHALGREELGSVVAHELAHIYRYPLYYQKGLFLHITASACMAVCIWSFGFHAMLSLLAIGAYYFVLNFTFDRYSRVVEYLCDDCGAEIVGLAPALRAEFLVSQHSEIVSRALYLALKQKLNGQNISLKEIQSTIDDALTFDPPEAEDLEREVRLRLQAHEVKSNNSFFHFFKNLAMSEGPDNQGQLEKHYSELKLVNSIPVIELPPGSDLSSEWFKELVQRIENEPTKPLFRVPEELTDKDSTHPSPRKRIAYLWLNHKATSPFRSEIR